MYTFQDFGGRVVGIGDRDGSCHDDNNDGADAAAAAADDDRVVVSLTVAQLC